MCKIVKPLLKRGFTDVSSFKVKENKNDSNQNSGFSEGNCQIYVTTVSAKAKGKNQSVKLFTCKKGTSRCNCILFCASFGCCLCLPIDYNAFSGRNISPSFFHGLEASILPTDVFHDAALANHSNSQTNWCHLCETVDKRKRIFRSGDRVDV